MIAPLKSSKRPIIEVSINGKPAYMLLDTGASLSLIDENRMKEYGFVKGASFAGKIVGIAGDSSGVYHTKKLQVDIIGIHICQFLTTDLSAIANSVKKETGIHITGIIGYPQIVAAEIKIMSDENYIKIGS